MRQFIINYQGTKYKESKELDNIDFSKYKEVVEPFCGSFGFSRYLYSDRGYKDIKYTFYDLDDELIDFYNHIKELIEKNEFEDFISVYNKYNDILKDKFTIDITKNKRLLNRIDIKKYILELDNKYIKYLLTKNVVESIITSTAHKHFKNIHIDDINLIKNSTFICGSFVDIDFNEKDKKNTLYYLDPPYILSDNSRYNYKNIEDIFEIILKLYNENYICMFVHSYNFLLNYVFKKYKFMNYDKKYGNTRRIVDHVVYYNP